MATALCCGGSGHKSALTLPISASDTNKMVGTDALNTLVCWMRGIRDEFARWIASRARVAEKKKEQRRETDQRLRREDRRGSLGADRQ
jgi:hypothetical protein